MEETAFNLRPGETDLTTRQRAAIIYVVVQCNDSVFFVPWVSAGFSSHALPPEYGCVVRGETFCCAGEELYMQKKHRLKDFSSLVRKVRSRSKPGKTAARELTRLVWSVSFPAGPEFSTGPCLFLFFLFPLVHWYRVA